MLDALETLIVPLYYAVSAVLLGWHWLWTTAGIPNDSGWNWALSIIGLTLVVRVALIPLFVKQIKSSRNMQMLQPRVKDLQKKYGHDRERLAQETMALYKDAGTNPFASCLPILAQAPVFFALFRVINVAVGDDPRGLGLLSDTDAENLEAAELLGARIADTFIDAWPGDIGVMAFSAVLVVAMTATTFTTQRQLMRKNMPESALTGPYAQQQKMLLYILPLAFGFGGVFFPIGVLFYWTTSNLWTMGQQFYVIRNNPAPGTPAFDAKRQRDIKHGRAVDPEPEQPTKRPEQPRQQPRKQSRKQRGRADGNRATPGPAPKKPPAPGKAGPPKKSGSSGASGGKQAKTRRPDGDPGGTAGRGKSHPT